jgi:hypothetical protein
MDESDRHAQPTMVGPSIAPTLEIVRGNEQGKTTRLKLTTRIGRERDNDLVLTDPKVSRYHARIELVEGQWTILDLGSANGTSVNDQPITDPHPLASDDRIIVGDTELMFKPSHVSLDVSPSPSVPRPQKPQPVQLPVGTPPQWGKVWLVGGLVLVVALVGITLFALSRLGREDAQLPGTTATALDQTTDGFILVYEDDFSDPSSGWDDAFDRYTTKQYGNNKYYVDITTSNLVAWGLANRSVSDFRLEVDAAQEMGSNNNGYGVLFRFQDRDNFYRFDISGDGFFLLSKFHAGEWVTLVPWTASSAINVGQAANRLFVEAVGSQIRVYANNDLLAELEDDTFAKGNFGFFASTFSEPNLTVSFDDIKLWTPKGEALAIIPTVTPTRLTRPTLTAAELALESEAVSQTEASTSTQAAELMVSPSQSVTREPTATVTLAPSPTATSTPEPLPGYVSRDLPPARNATVLRGRFIFPAFDSRMGTYHIFSASPDGDDRVLLATEASQPAVSADGQRIVFRSWKADNRGLVERGIESDDVWRFNSYVESARPTFAPDGQMFLFHSREAGEAPAVYRTTGADYEVLRRDGAPIQGEAPAWTPDGNHFVYKGCLGGGCGLILSSLDGSAGTQLTFDPSDTNPAVSPDGQNIVFMSYRTGNWDVYKVSIDGTDLTQLTTDLTNDGLPTWAPNGRTIAFVSDRDGAWAMWAMNVNGKNQRPLFDLQGSIDGQVQVDVQNARGWLEERIVWSVAGSETQ